MSTDTKPQRIHNGLSPSSFALFTGCQRKYYHKKVAKTPIDFDASEDTEAFRVGKAFHKCLENTRHKLEGFTYGQAKEVICGEYKLDEHMQLPMIFAMLGKYKVVHEKAKLEVIACEQVIDVPDFYGIVDVVLTEPTGHWWIGDMKTAAVFTQNLIPTLPAHPQLNLYVEYSKTLAEELRLDPNLLKGCRYRVTTKSKLSRKKDEAPASFIQRLTGSIRSLDIAIPIEAMQPGIMGDLHGSVLDHTLKYQDEVNYGQNFGGCMAYFKPCEYWSKCHGEEFSKMGDLAIIDGDA